MSDIKKGYTFTDKSTDWVSNKETAIRLNKMLDEAKVNLVAGANITITPTANGPSISSTAGGTGTVTSVNLTAGTGVSVSGGPITTSGSITVNNTAPDQVVSLTGAGTTTVTGTYPSFTISSADSTTGTVTSVAATAGTGITVSGSPITTSGTLTITNSAPDQTVSLTGAGTTSITGTYPSFTVTSNDAFTGTVTSVSGTGTVSGLSLSGTVTSSGSLTLGGTLAVTPSAFAVQTEKTFFAGPASGASATPAFRAIASTDLPAFGSGDVAFAVAGGAGTIAADAVTNAKMADMAANTVKVNATAGLANPTDLSVGTNTVVGRVAGNIVAAQVATGQIADNAVTFAKLQDGVANTVLARADATNGDVAGVALAASQLLGRGPSGNIAAISLGTNLSITGTTLNAAAGGGAVSSVTGTANEITSSPTTGAVVLSLPASLTFTGKTVTNGTFNSPTLVTPALGTPTSGLLNSCTSNPNATGASARTFQARAGDVFNVKDFGAVGDDSNDDTTAIAAALLAACSASRGATVYFPHGTYKVSDTFTGSFGVNNEMYGLTITGDGIGTTIIKQYGTNKGVFHLTNTAVAGCLTLKDFSCWNQSGVMSTLQCIRYEVSQIAVDDAHSNLQISNLSITPPFGAGTWTIGLDLYRVHNGSILNYQYSGNNTGGGTGIVFQQSGTGSPSGAKKSMACFIQGCQINLCHTGVRIKDAMETCLIQECVMVGLVYGVYSDYCIHLGVSNSHINVNPAAYVAGTFVVGLTYEILSLGSPTPTDFTLIGAASNTVGVVFTATGVGAGNGLAGIPGIACIFSSGTGGDVDQSIIVGNLLYSQGYSNLMGIKGGFVRSSFSGNSFIALGGQTGTRGISVTGKGLSITGNSFYQHTNSYITSSATYSIISSNTATIVPGAVATTPYDITGTGTTSANNIYEP